MDDTQILGPGLFDFELTLKAANVSFPLLAIVPLIGGANNRVFRLDLDGGSPLILKSYFHHDQDLRPRLQMEFSFLSYAWDQGIRCIPQPLYQAPDQHLALYTHLDGKLATSAHARLSFIEAASSFLAELNRNPAKGRHLLYASEACLQCSDYIQTVEKKLNWLLSSPQEEKNLHSFLKKRLLPEWAQVKNKVCKADLHALDPTPKELILTPSDFGLHNVLVSSVSDCTRYCFIDFEYAGWDDPVKTICDFFLQPKIPISWRFFDFFFNAMAQWVPDRGKIVERTRLMLSVCKIKWCCIILNVFSKKDSLRRIFSQREKTSSKEKQLELAEMYLNEHAKLDIDP